MNITDEYEESIIQVEKPYGKETFRLQYVFAYVKGSGETMEIQGQFDVPLLFGRNTGSEFIRFAQAYETVKESGLIAFQDFSDGIRAAELTAKNAKIVESRIQTTQPTSSDNQLQKDLVKRKPAMQDQAQAA